MPREHLYSVLREGIRDFVSHGFDSTSRLRLWLVRLRLSAENSVPQPEMLRRQAVSRFQAVFQSVLKGRLKKRHKGLPSYSIDRIKPQLIREYDKRLMAVSEITHFQQTDAIEHMLRSFSGWATSVRPNAGETVDVSEVTGNIYRTLKNAANENRMAIKDQTDKLENSLSGVIAHEFGAIAGIWHSRWRDEGYQYREIHKEHDEKVFLFSDTWATKHSLVKPGEAGWAHDVDDPGALPHCKCYWTYLYRLSDLPEIMLSTRGKQALIAEDVTDGQDSRGF